MAMLKLGINIDHVATLRQARYRDREEGEPNPVDAAGICEEAGAHGITAHLREDRRHMLDRDIWAIKKVLRTRLNFEMANTPEMVDIALRLKPGAVCLVPEKREEVTTEGGLDVVGQLGTIRETTRRLNGAGIEVSLFIDPDKAQVDASAETGCEFVELHTGNYAEVFENVAERDAALARLNLAANQAKQRGLGVNAGHGINYKNITDLLRVANLIELNIGHSIVSRSIVVGLRQAVIEMLELMHDYPSTR